MIKPYAVVILVQNLLSRFETNVIIVSNKVTSFALPSCMDFCPVVILDEPYCLNIIDNIEDQRGKGHGKPLMKNVLDHFQITIHSLSAGFYKHMSKELACDRIDTDFHFTTSLTPFNLKVNLQTSS